MIKHFLLRHNMRTRHNEIECFDDDASALEAYSREERRCCGTDIEVVLLGADSIETVERTHSSYFATGDMIGSMLP